MKNNCPKCNSQETYRKHPHDLTVYCEQCHYSWEANQVLKPLLEQKVYRRRNPKGTHIAKIWLCPIDKNKYSFSISYGSGAVAFKEFEEDPFLSGSFNSPEEALNAGVIKAMD